MENSDLSSFYEKQYFHELETREKVLNRLQIPLAVVVLFVSFYGYIARNIEIAFSGWNLLVYLLLMASIIVFILSLYNFIRAFFNHTYELLPTAVETEDYRKELIDLYKNYPTADQLVKSAFDDYLHKYYAECATANTKINDKRSSYIHNCNKWLVTNLPLLFLIFVIFSFSGIDQSAKDKDYAVRILNPIVLESIDGESDIRSASKNNGVEEGLSDTVEELPNDPRPEEE